MSLFTTISGITNNQAMLDVIGDNIANINTTAFKASKINFATIFSNTLSSGGAPTANLGGVNPKQIGIGVTISEISKNFTRGAIQSTGRTSDLNIQGEGFFTLQDATGKMVLSRAGNFSVDSQGNLVNAAGCKVLGTSNITSPSGSATTINIPNNLVLDETNTISSGGVNLTPGDFTVTVNGTAHTITVEETDTIQDVVNYINSELSASSAALNSAKQIVISGSDVVSFTDGTSNFATLAGLTTGYTTGTVPVDPADGIFTVSVNGGAAQNITIAAGDTNTDAAASIQALLTPGSTATYNAVTGKIEIVSPDNLAFADGTSTFASDSNFVQGNYVSEGFTDTPQVSISEGDPTSTRTIHGVDTSNNFSAVSYSILNDGAIEVSYSNGARLTVTTEAGSQARTLKYITSDSREITGLTTTAVDPAQLQLQLAQVINPKGLEAVGGNLYEITSVAGEPNFAIGGGGGMGSIDSGALEASNVDLPTEFANMILAQKAIEANSRAFSIQNQMLDVIVNLGR